MAPAQISAIIALLAVFVSLVSAKEYVVGDDNGWNINIDYQAWAQGKQFHVGDKLVFNYKVGFHSVIRVNETGFQQCSALPPSEPLTTGNDVITLTDSGPDCYICGTGCKSGNQRLSIDVLPLTGSPAPSPSPVSAAPGFAAYSWMMGLMLGIVLMVAV